jgi:hypothetical protein
MTASHATPAAGILKGVLVAVVACAGLRPAWADSLPPSVRACAAVADALQRLECYDREVARASAISPPAPMAGPANPAPTPAPAPAPAPTVATAPVLPAAVSPAVPPAPAAPAVAAAPAATAKHLAARVSKVDHYGSEITVHLDNGQVWQQSQPADRDLNLHPGDAVTLDRELGSWWLSAGTASMQVKLQR